MFDNWTDDQFAAWLAGFFDGEGCIYLGNKKATAFEVSVSNTNRQVIEGIFERVKVGYLMEITFKNNDWNTKYTWRVRRFEDCNYVLNIMVPYLVIKKDKALEGIRRYNAAVESKRNLDLRNATIIEMAKAGMRQVDIAQEFGLTQTAICAIVKGRSGTGKKTRNLTQMRRYEENDHKKHVQAITSYKKLSSNTD